MMPSVSAKKILIIQTAFIGDTILMSSFAALVAEHFKDSEIHLLVRKGNQITVDGLSFVKKVWIWDKTQNKLRELMRLASQIKLEKFDIVFNLHRHASSGFITAQSGAKYKVGFTQNPLSYFYTHKMKHQIPHKSHGHCWHEVQRNASLLTLVLPNFQVPADPKLIKPLLPVSTVNHQKVAHLIHSCYAVIAPASVWFTKQWPEEHFTNLAQMIARKMPVYLIGGPDDKDLCERVRAENPKIENLAGKLNLLDSAALMAKATRVIVNDSSPLHLASAVNAPTTAVFCSTIEDFGYYPLSDDSQVMTIDRDLSCRPCGLHGKKSCPKGHFECGYGISVERVLKTIDF